MSRSTLTRAPDPHAAPPVAIATRRDLFGTMGAMLLLTAAEAGTAKAAELDGELLECCAEASRLETRADKLVAGLLPVPPLAAAWWEADCLQEEAYSLLDRAISLPARTPEGLQAKARVVIVRLGPDSLAGHMAMSLARDVLGRSGS